MLRNLWTLPIRTSIFLFCVYLTLIHASPINAKEVTLAFKPPDGTTFLQTLTSTKSRSLNGKPDNERAVTAITKGVIKKTQDGYSITQSSLALEKPELMPKEMDPITQIFSELIITYVTDDNGSILEIKGLENFDQRLKEELPQKTYRQMAAFINREALELKLNDEWESKVGNFAGTWTLGQAEFFESYFPLPNGQEIIYYSTINIAEELTYQDKNCVRIKMMYSTDANKLGDFTSDVLNDALNEAGKTGDLSSSQYSIEGSAEIIMDPSTMLIYDEVMERTVSMHVEFNGESGIVSEKELKIYKYEYLSEK